MQISKRLLLSRPCNRWQRWHAAGRRRRTVKPALSAPRKELAFSGKFIGFTAHADCSRFKGLAASAVSRRRQRRHPTTRRSAAPQSRPQWNPATATFGCGSVVQLMPIMISRSPNACYRCGRATVGSAGTQRGGDAEPQSRRYRPLAKSLNSVAGSSALQLMPTFHASTVSRHQR